MKRSASGLPRNTKRQRVYGTAIWAAGNGDLALMQLCFPLTTKYIPMGIMESALIAAADNDHIELVRYILNFPVDPSVSNNIVLELCYINNNYEMLKLILLTGRVKCDRTFRRIYRYPLTRDIKRLMRLCMKKH